MSDYNAADTKDIRRAQKLAKATEAERAIVLANLMSSAAGRAWVYDLLEATHIYSTSYSASAIAMSFSEGERNVGLRLLNAIVATCPDQYIQLMREANDRSSASSRPSGSDTQRGRNGDDSRPEPDGAGAGAISDYEPGAFDDVGA